MALARFILPLAFFVLGAGAARAQETAPADTVIALPGVEVSALGWALASPDAPFALASRARGGAEMASADGSLGAALAGLPGVWVSERGSYAQGDRLLVRGLGWRAAFGVRGTHVLLDGVPLTLPDGQAQLGAIDPALVTRAEVLRGPASTFWGSGSGGVLSLSTLPEAGAPALRLRAEGGGFGRASASFAVRPLLGAGRRAAAWGSVLREDGYRDHSAVRLARLGASAALPISPHADLALTALLSHMPRAESPGGIAFDDAEVDPRQTRAIVIERDASKAVTQGYLSANLGVSLGAARLSIAAHGGLRSLDNPIVPRYIRLDRQTFGARVAAHSDGAALAWAVGAEGEVQRDDRLENDNDAGSPGAIVLTDQVETVRSGALFGQLRRSLGARLSASAALRGDVLRYCAEPAGEAASARTLGALSPAVGLSLSFGASGGPRGVAFVNVAGALDAPTTTELGNRADGASGFSPDLQPERTWGGEVGARGAMPLGAGALGFDVAVFAAAVRDLLVPFEIDDVTFYRNEGRTRHAGVEIALSPSALPLLGGTVRGDLAYAWTRARFAESAGSLVVEGNAVPGVPEHLTTGTLAWSGPRGVFAQVQGESASGYAADSDGSARTDAYAILHIRLAAQLRLPRTRVTPYAALRNALDARYTGSVVVNAFGGRYAEPGAGRHAVVGVTVDLGAAR